MTPRPVEIVVSNVVAGSYEARSYPNEQTDASGRYNLYRVPVFKILVRGTDERGQKTSDEFMAPRFMPFFNDPIHPDPHYTIRGWVNAGLSSPRTVAVTQYKQDYRVQNRYSPGVGAIVVHQSFYIHAGPASLDDIGFGSAGCIEIVGDYNKFKRSIARMAGLDANQPDSAIQKLVAVRKLIVTIQHARVPDIRNQVTRQIKD